MSMAENSETSPETTGKTHEESLKLAGLPGKYGYVMTVMIGIIFSQAPINHLVSSVYVAQTDHHCHLPDGMEPDNRSIPEVDGKLDSCHIYKNYTYLNEEAVNCPDGWDYILQDGESTVVNEWNLVCDLQYVPNLAGTIYFAGLLVGGFVCGQIADRIGRRPMLLISLYISILLGVLVSLAENLILFMFLRFITGILIQGLVVSSQTMAIEQATDARTKATFIGILDFFWSGGIMYIALMAYVFKNWRWMQLGLSLPYILTIAYVWFIPESFRWQTSKGKFQGSLTYLKKAATMNKVTLPNSLEGDLKQHCELNVNSNVKSPEPKYSLLHALKMPNLRKHTLVMFCLWMFSAMGYFGISLNASRLSEDKHLNYFISGVIEIPVYAIVILLNMRVGRRIPSCVYFLIGGVACISSGLIPRETASGTQISWVSTMLAWIGKASMAALWGSLPLYSSEIFPTLLRTSGMGACYFFARFGAMISPQINLIGDYTYSWIAIMIYGVVALLGGFLTLLLPETKNHPLPNTLEEAEALGKKSRLCKTNANVTADEAGVPHRRSSNTVKLDELIDVSKVYNGEQNTAFTHL